MPFPRPDSSATPWLWPEVPPAAPPAVAEKEGAKINITPGFQRMLEGMQNWREGELDLGIRKLEQVIEMEPSLLGAWEDLGWAYWRKGWPDKAIALWERLRRLAPASPVPHNLLGRAAMAQGRWEDAERFFRQSLTLDPYAFEPQLAHAMALGRLGRAHSALPVLRELAAERPERNDVRLELARTLSALALYEEAANHWRALSTQTPENAEPLREYALCLLYSGEIESAREAAQRAADLDPENIRGLLLLADIAESGSDPADAAEQIRSILQQTESPLSRARLRMRRCELLQQLRRMDPERFPLTPILEEGYQALQDDPRLLAMSLFLAEVLLLEGRFSEAEKEFQSALTQNPRNSRALRGLFETATAQSRWEDAEKIHRKMEGPFYPTMARLLDAARLAFGRGQWEEALRNLDRLEREAARGAVLILGYRRLAASDWEPALSLRRFSDQLASLRRAGFVFITPEQLADAFKPEAELSAKSLPVPARFFRWLRQEIREPSPVSAPSVPGTPPFPQKKAMVLFQGAFRDTLRLAHSVADELEIPMTVHHAAGDQDRRAAGAASWSELRPLLASPFWRIGSFGLDSDIPAPIDPDGYEAPPLPNRLWNPDRKRLETLREWNARVRREMRESRARIEEKVGLSSNTSLSIVYPFGDIGQAGLCNIGAIENVPALILNEAGAVFQYGFLPDARGYALAEDPPMSLPFYEPGSREEGPALLRHALEHHPLLAARRLRAEIAALQGKPWLANEQIELLERDGWPPELLHPLREYVRQRLAGLPPSPPRATPSDSRFHVLKPTGFFLGLEGRIEEANRDYREQMGGFHAGLGLNPRNTLEAWGRVGSFDQETRSNRWFTIRQTTVTETRTTTRTVQDGQKRQNKRIVRREVTREVETNETLRVEFHCEALQAGVAFLHQFRDGSALRLHAGTSRREGDAFSKTLLEFGAVHRWKPWESLECVTAFDRSAVPSARAALARSSLSLTAIWLPADRWEIVASGAYSEMSDTNALLNLSAQALGQLGTARTLQAGLRAELTTADDPREEYWTPYWNERVFLIGRFRKAYPRFHAESELRLGLSREKGRPDDLAAWRDRKIRGEREGWDPGEEPGSDWEPVIGVGLSFDRRLGKNWSLNAAGACSFYSDYSEYRLEGALRRHFGEYPP